MATDTKIEELVFNDYTRDGAVIPDPLPENQLSITPDKSLEKVEHDATLTGDGTADSPLSVVGGGSGSGTDNNGLEGDYAVTYGIDDETKSGLPYIKAVGSRVVVIPAPLELDVPGQPGLTTIATPIEYEVQSTDNPTLFYAQGEIIEATDVFFQVEEPEDGTTGYAAWWNGTTWQFKSNDSGNVWRPANAVRIAKTVFTGTSLTRLCFTGCRVLNKQEYASKQQLSDGLAGKADKSDLDIIDNNIDSLYEEVGEKLDSTSAASTYANKSTDFMTPIASDNKGATKTEIDALDDKIDIAGTSGKIIGSYWFGKTNASAEVPAPTLVGQNYYDFTTGQVYKSTDGTTWTLNGTNTPPTDIDAQIIISSKFWNIPEQENQHGGKAWWSHTNAEWSYSPTIYEDKPVGATMPILDKKVSDFKFNDVSYLNANTFSWQDGGMYMAAYQHLVEDLATAGAVQTVTIEGVTISFEVATDGHRICLPTQETAISQLYAKTGEADFYILDTENARFKLPRTQERKLIRAVNNADGSWYNLYSDGFVEQAGYAGTGVAVQLLVPMRNSTYNVSAIPLKVSDGAGTIGVEIVTRSPTAMEVEARWNGIYADSNGCLWKVEGYASDSVLANEPVQYEYYYVGNFEQSSIEQTAGINAETLNQKVDVGHQVIEFQAPTAANGYTWYRKYADGWVEQGGLLAGYPSGGSANNQTISLPVTMSNNKYTVLVTMEDSNTSSQINGANVSAWNKTVNSFVMRQQVNEKNWQVVGMAAE